MDLSPTEVVEERWVDIQEFPMYRISDQGRVYNLRTDRLMKVGRSNHGHSKISLLNEFGRQTVSVALLVARAFVESPGLAFDSLIILDGDFTNIAHTNIMWRPKHFAWHYTRQMKTHQPVYYHNLHVEELVTGTVYENIFLAGTTNGLLFLDIWKSTYKGTKVFPTNSMFRVVERV